MDEIVARGSVKEDTDNLPRSWKVARFADCVEVKSGQVDPTQRPYSEMLHVGPENVEESTGRLLRCQTAESLKLISGKYLFTPEDVIYSKIRPYLRKAVLVDFTGICSADMYPLRPCDHNLSRDFLYFWLLSDQFTRQAVSYQNRTGIPKINRQQLSSTILPLPPLPEQKAVADLLHTVQRAKEATEKVITATRQLKQSLMRHLFTYGPVPFRDADKVEVQDTDVGLMPDEWPLRNLETVADIVYGVQAAVAHLKDKSVGIPILTNVNISNDGVLNLSLLRYYDLPATKQEKLLLRKRDVLFNWRSGSNEHVGKSAIFDAEGEFTFSSFILRFRANDEVIPEFLFHYLIWLKSNGYFAQNRQQSSVNKVFNASAAARIPIPVPVVKVQQDICERIAGIDKKLRAEKRSHQAIDVLFQSLLHRLMTGAIRVPDAERAIEEVA